MFYPIRYRWLTAAPLLIGALLAGSCKKSDDPGNGGGGGVTPTATGPVTSWLTTPDKTALFYRQKLSGQFVANTNSNPTIVVDTTQTYQTIDGFGYALTGGSAQLMSQMSASSRAGLIKELFSPDSVGVSYLRVSIGSSDLDAQTFTYDEGAVDPTLANFSLAPDQNYLIPVLKEILAVNPNIKIMGSPWTAPTWMKQGASAGNPFVGGSLQTQYYAAYAQYFVKYIQGMKAQGITIDAITIQNEPLYGGNNPSMVMQGSEQANFIKNNLGPALKAAGLTTKIIGYDHNPDTAGISFVNTLLGDAAAAAYVDGTAFHLYGGTIGALDGVHTNYPAKNIYFTEFWTKAPGTTTFGSDLLNHIGNMEIGAVRNWSRNVLEWNLASDPGYGPHTSGGCTECLGAITISGNTVTRNVAYYTIAHSSKVVRPGSVRVATNQPANLANVAYKTPNGKRCLVVLNTGSAVQNFNIQYKGKVLSATLYGGSVATYMW